MALVQISPEYVMVAASDCSSLTSGLRQTRLGMREPTMAITPAGADEVSHAIAGAFSRFAVVHHESVDRAEGALRGFATTLAAAAKNYAITEAGTASGLGGSPAAAPAQVDTAQLIAQFAQRLAAPPTYFAQELASLALMGARTVVSFGLFWWAILNFSTFALKNLLMSNPILAIWESAQ